MNLRIAAIGVGHWHALHDAAYLKTLVQWPGMQLIAVHDPDLEIAAQRAAQLGSPPAYADYLEMLDKTHPDFVIALGRHDAMAETAHTLLDLGYPFLMEKPMGLNAREVQTIAERAAAKQAFVAVPLFQRYHPFLSQARRMLDEGNFGPVSHFYFRSNRGSSARYVAWGAPWMLDPALAGGGCLRNIGLHGIDAFIHLFGDGDIEVTGAQTSTRALGARVEDYASVLVRAPDGVLGTVEVGNVFPGAGADAEWKIAGRDALLAQRGPGLTCATRDGERDIPGHAGEPLPAVALREALSRWRGGRPPLTGPEDCYRAMRVIDRAYEIAFEHRARAPQ